MRIIEFIHDSSWQDFPDEVKSQARRCLLDTAGAAVGGRRTRLSQIIRDFSASVCSCQGAHLWLDGREVSPPGAALAYMLGVTGLCQLLAQPPAGDEQ
jgi:2-methylcitrate dehydratase PrpD